MDQVTIRSGCQSEVPLTATPDCELNTLGSYGKKYKVCGEHSPNTGFENTNLI